MALMALFRFWALGSNLHGILAAPALYTGFGQSQMTNFSAPGLEAGLLSPLPLLTPHAREDQYALSVTIPTTTVTVTIVQEATTIILPPTTVTAIIVLESSSATSTPTSTPSLMPTNGLTGFGLAAKAVWTQPAQLNSLTPFGITSGGKQNLEIVSKIPAAAMGDSSNVASRDAPPNSNDPTSILQISYPAGSCDPGHEPRGGTEFYASPIDISDAQNVTLTYSVFFPEIFDFVLAGKLPGLYGGHTGCSGGNDALDCFSTRLMWRKGGAGELYLYAPKYKQTSALCSDHGSTCDAAYGLSIGRGSFQWATGGWTTIVQTVVLNTPGMQNGVFVLDVDGKRVIDRADVLYRLADSGSNDEEPTSVPKKRTKSTKPVKTTSTPDATRVRSTPTPESPDDHLGLLGNLVQRFVPRGVGLDRMVNIPVTADLVPTSGESSLQPTISSHPHNKNHQPAPTTTTSLDNFNSQSSSDGQVGFKGIFFSTFFGGHGAEYETPSDQYAFFKDFGLAYNS